MNMPGTSCSRGFTLVPTLILLLAVALLGSATTQWVLLTSRSAHADRQHQIAYCAALAALDDAMLDISRTAGTAVRLHTSATETTPYGRFTGQIFPFGEGMPSARLPHYRIEPLPPSAPTTAPQFRITATGFGPTPARTIVQLQAIFQPPLAGSGSGRLLSFRLLPASSATSHD